MNLNSSDLRQHIDFTVHFTHANADILKKINKKHPINQLKPFWIQNFLMHTLEALIFGACISQGSHRHTKNFGTLAFPATSGTDHHDTETDSKCLE